MQPIVVTDLTVAFRSGPALSGIDLTAGPGRRIALIGENGSGKSTLLRGGRGHAAGVRPGQREHQQAERPRLAAAGAALRRG